MLSKSNWREVMGVVILYIGSLFGLTSFVSADDKSKPDCALCGHITDSTTGEAITDATIEIHGGPNSKAETDANGFYCFDKISEQGNYRIGIDSNEYVGIYNYDEMPVVNLKGDNQVVKDFKLDRACMIKVQVADEANQPVENAEISVNYLADERTRRIGSDMRRRRTDKEGFCLVGGIPPKTKCQITATHGINITSLRKDGYGVVQTQWDYAPSHLEVTLTDTEVIESSKIVLQKGVDVNGIAKYQDGVPASDLKITAYPDWWISYTCPESYPIDANGRFTFRHIVPGIYRIQVNIPTGEGSSKGINVLQTALPVPNNELLTLTIPQKSPQALASIRGKFTFAGDKVPNYVDIQAYSPGSGHNSFMWHKYGRDACDTNFVIDRLEPGKYQLTFSSQEIEQKVIEEVNAPCEDLLVELSPCDKMFLRGTVLNSENNQPIQNFKARARKTKILRGARYQQPDKWLEVDDAEGRFSIDATGPGIYQVQIAAEGFAWTWSEDVNTDSNNPVVIKLAAGGGIKGKVVNSEGKPIKGAKVLPLSMAGGMWIITNAVKDPFVSEDGAVETADDGTFELKHLAPGRESVKVIHPDYAYSTVNDIEVKEGQTTEGINVVMPAGGAVEGYVYDAQGLAQPNVTLYFQDIYSFSSDDKAGRFATVTTDANGFYQATGLPEQLLTVKRQKAWDSMGVVCRALAPANGRVSHIDLGGKPIVSGRIIINGAPLANRRVVLSSAESPNSDVFRCNAMTEPDGKFAFGGVPNGKWKIYCEDTETRGDWIKIATAEAAGQDVDLGVVSVTLSTIRASIEYEKESPKWDIKYANLQEGDNPWNIPVKKAILPTDKNAPYIVKNIPAGEYRLSLIRQDYVAFRQSIEVNETDVNVTIPMPKSTSGIHGHLTGKFPAGQTIWTRDKSIVGNIMPDAGLNYKLDNLPAGHYYVGGNMLIDSAALLEFDLADGEQKILDINVPDSPKNQSSPLLVLVLDENGAPLLGAEVRLLGGESVIEPIVDSSQGIYFMAEQGAYTLQVNFPGYKAVTQQVSVARFDPKNIQAFRKPILVRLERQ
jgi:uncharacterized GH25 family protein